MKGSDLAKEIKDEEFQQKASILKAMIKSSNQELKGLEEQRKAIMNSLRETNKMINSERDELKLLLEKDVESVKLHTSRMTFSNFNCRCQCIVLD